MLPTWTQLVSVLIAKHLLQLLCVDKVHLFITFGLTFWKSFLQMKSLIYDKLKLQDGNLNTPILYMTATLNNHMLLLLQQTTDTFIYPSNLFWRLSSSFSNTTYTYIANTQTRI